MDVSVYQAKSYGSDRPCWDLVADVLMNERGLQPEVCKTISGSIRAAASAFRLEVHKGAHGFVQIEQPVDFAVVLMGRTIKIGIHHCGIAYAGKVLHALPDGVVYQDLSSLRDEYQVMEFWAQ